MVVAKGGGTPVVVAEGDGTPVVVADGDGTPVVVQPGDMTPVVAWHEGPRSPTCRQQAGERHVVVVFLPRPRLPNRIWR